MPADVNTGGGNNALGGARDFWSDTVSWNQYDFVRHVDLLWLQSLLFMLFNA